MQDAWGLTVRDGYGQTETTAQVGNPPGAAGQARLDGPARCPATTSCSSTPRPARSARPRASSACSLDPRPVALMKGYKATADTFDDALNAESFTGGVYHTGDVVSRDEDGYLTYVGRADDVFKSSDYKISPFELESVLIEHPAVAEAAVVAAPDPIRLAVPKAYVFLAGGHAPDAETARSILAHAREHLAPYQRVRRLEFHRAAQDDQRQDPPRRAARGRGGPRGPRPPTSSGTPTSTGEPRPTRLPRCARSPGRRPAAGRIARVIEHGANHGA